MPARRILRLARTSRWAMVASGTMKARAISGVVSPPRVRRVSATLASSDRAGWQQVKTSRSRSSGMVCISLSCPRAASSRARVARRSASPRSRRSRSMALLRAVVVIQAPGRSGTPAAGQRSMATRKASWTASSARSKSPRTRMRVATACPDSSRNTRSTSARASVATLTPRRLPSLGGHVDLHDRPDLDRPAADVGDPGRQLDGLVQVLGLDQVEAAQLLLGLVLGDALEERALHPVVAAAGRLRLGRGERLERHRPLHQLVLEHVEGGQGPLVGLGDDHHVLARPGQRGAGVLEVEALRQLLSCLVDRVVDLLAVDLGDDVERGVGHGMPPSREPPGTLTDPGREVRRPPCAVDGGQAGVGVPLRSGMGGSVGFSRQFTGGFDDIADAREFVAAALLRDTELYEAARLLVDEAITNPLLHSQACETSRAFQVTVAFRPDLLHVEVRDDGTPLPLDRDGTRPASVAGRSLELFDALALAWDSSAPPDRRGHVVWFDLEA